MTADPAQLGVGRDDKAPYALLARAKVNLWLHVVGQRADGYHLLDSLVAFPEIGDLLEAEPSPFLSLTIEGPFSLELGAGPDNIVLQAAEGLAQRLGGGLGAALRLEKRLPVASGIGGGSADAATALKLLLRLWGRPVAADALHDLALSLGADVPACFFAPGPVFLRGVGEKIDAAPTLPHCALLLVNPGVPVATPQVFAALEQRENPPPPTMPPLATLDNLVAWLLETRNDLQAAALSIAPQIGDVLEALDAAEECRFARMSGSGATCFGIFASAVQAREAETAIRAAHPSWWTGVGAL